MECANYVGVVSVTAGRQHDKGMAVGTPRLSKNPDAATSNRVPAEAWSRYRRCTSSGDPSAARAACHASVPALALSSVAISKGDAEGQPVNAGREVVAPSRYVAFADGPAGVSSATS